MGIINEEYFVGIYNDGKRYGKVSLEEAHVANGGANQFLIRENKIFVNFRLGLASQVVSITVAQFCHYSNKAAIGSM